MSMYLSLCRQINQLNQYINQLNQYINHSIKISTTQSRYQLLHQSTTQSIYQPSLQDYLARAAQATDRLQQVPNVTHCTVDELLHIANILMSFMESAYELGGYNLFVGAGDKRPIQQKTHRGRPTDIKRHRIFAMATLLDSLGQSTKAWGKKASELQYQLLLTRLEEFCAQKMDVILASVAWSFRDDKED
jgi:hypothetical protein